MALEMRWDEYVYHVIEPPQQCDDVPCHNRYCDDWEIYRDPMEPD